MDYTKILSALGRVKIALDEKIGTVITNINTLANALDKALTSVKQEVTGVKQEVTGVKTDVADVKQAITAANALADEINGEVV